MTTPAVRLADGSEASEGILDFRAEAKASIR